MHSEIQVKGSCINADFDHREAHQTRPSKENEIFHLKEKNKRNLFFFKDKLGTVFPNQSWCPIMLLVG